MPVGVSRSDLRSRSPTAPSTTHFPNPDAEWETQHGIRLAPAAPLLVQRVQLSFILRDIDAVARHWTDTLRVGPFVVINLSRADRTVMYRGKETLSDWAIAFAYMGDVQTDLIQPLTRSRPPTRGFSTAGAKASTIWRAGRNDYPATCAYLEQNGFTGVRFTARTAAAPSSTRKCRRRSAV
ncbi:MAG: VOC family protein [Mesorhizobium sp.]|nr:MAG: VOC family protein [Mesorhizobium sp.]